jgi:ankyrin repeat protein
MRVAPLGWCVLALSVCSWTADASSDRRVPDAAKQRDAAALKALIAEGADVNGRQPDGATALHWATHWDDLEGVVLLVRGGADVNAANDLGVTPLELACTNAAIARALLDAGANANQPLPTGETPLMTAAGTGDAAVVAALLAHGADPNAKEPRQKQTALIWAAARKHAGAAQLLLQKGADPQARAAGGFTPLLFAARTGDVDTAAVLLNAGANVNDAADDGSGPLLIATIRGHVALVRFLLDYGADPNAAGPGYAPLHWAAGSWETELSGRKGIRIERDEEWQGVRGLDGRRRDLVRMLIEYGADPNAVLAKSPSRFGFTVFRLGLAGATPFFLAAMAGDADVMRDLVAAGADPGRTTKDGTTPVMVASGIGRALAETRLTSDDTIEAVKLALELGNDVNAANTAGDTALHGAANIRSDAIVRLLAEKGAALDAKNKRGDTPLIIAERAVAAGGAPVLERTSTGDLLRKLGATTPDASGSSAR